MKLGVPTFHSEIKTTSFRKKYEYDVASTSTYYLFFTLALNVWRFTKGTYFKRCYGTAHCEPYAKSGHLQLPDKKLEINFIRIIW